MIVGIVDDDTRLAEMLSENLEQESHFTSDPSEMLSWVQNEEVDCVVTDLKMEPMGGLELLDSIRDENSSIPVILMTGHGSVDSAVEAMKKGARDYLQKPVSSEEFQIVIDRIEEEIQKRKQLEGFRVNQQERSSGESLLIGDSSSMKELRDLIKKVAGERLGVLIQGETGTGKELVAREIHALSNRGDAPFMTVNCAAIPENLLESELFGHEKGAFTGADERRKGKMELADGGTLFLDEIGELPLDLQPKLLRSLEQEEFTRVGGEFPQQVDVRFISATNRDLEKKIEEEDFRKDLYYRLNTLEIHTPPLRDHPEDIPMLVDHFLHNLP
ncbi:MAG: sigma-54-dependent transcriptional regulator, partial [bacterium]